MNFLEKEQEPNFCLWLCSSAFPERDVWMFAFQTAVRWGSFKRVFLVVLGKVTRGSANRSVSQIFFILIIFDAEFYWSPLISFTSCLKDSSSQPNPNQWKLCIIQTAYHKSLGCTGQLSNISLHAAELLNWGWTTADPYVEKADHIRLSICTFTALLSSTSVDQTREAGFQGLWVWIRHVNSSTRDPIASDYASFK